MSKAMEVTDISQELPETVLAAFSAESEKETVRRIVECFTSRGLTVKLKQYTQPCMDGTLRILCFIKKSAEAVIINNKGMGHNGMSVQVRIADRSVLGRLDDFSESIRNQILSAGGCGYCCSRCGDKKYVFTYREREYIKCHFICSNFTFQNIDEDNIDELVHIINNEINRKRKGFLQ